MYIPNGHFRSSLIQLQQAHLGHMTKDASIIHLPVFAIPVCTLILEYTFLCVNVYVTKRPHVMVLARVMMVTRRVLVRIMTLVRAMVLVCFMV